MVPNYNWYLTACRSPKIPFGLGNGSGQLQNLEARRALFFDPWFELAKVETRMASFRLA
jgi:hypothetical protein